MREESPRRWPLRLADILDAIARCKRFVGGRDREAFLSDEAAYNAVVLQLQIIGEAARHLPPELTARYPHDWREVVAMRHRLAHGYYSVDADVVWSTVTGDLGPLEAAVKEILAREPPD
jgi:uncharacterized protein with HEPN domain